MSQDSQSIVVGVLALQGDFAEHIKMLELCGVRNLYGGTFFFVGFSFGKRKLPLAGNRQQTGARVK